MNFTPSTGAPTPPLHLAFQADQNYVDGLVATLGGVARHLPRNRTATVSVIDCGIRPDTRQRLAQLVATRLKNLTLRFLPIDTAVLAKLPFPAGLAHANQSVYTRIFLPELLPDTDRVLYLDCDLLVDTDVSPLLDFPLHGALVAAAVDEEMKTTGETREFNSGVMLMDLTAMRADGLTRRAIAAASTRNTRHGDQTLLNELLRGRWTALDRRWNRQVFLLPTFSVFRTEPDTIWHIYMARKPWHFHRPGARGLVAEYHATLAALDWQPTFPPQLAMTASPTRDVLKHASAWIRRSFFRPRALPVS